MNEEGFFNLQLNRNLSEIINPPRHWSFVKEICEEHDFDMLVDVGCGVGTISKYLEYQNYLGIDYSKVAIQKATDNFLNDNRSFIIKDMTNVKQQMYVHDLIASDGYNKCLLQNAFLDVLEKGDETLRILLLFQFQYVLLMRVELTDKESYYDVYSPYKDYKSYKYYHNKENFYNLIKNYSYEIVKEEDAPVTFPESGAIGKYIFLKNTMYND